MKTFRFDQIMNKYNQSIYTFIHEEGNTEFEKFINFLNGHVVKFKQFNNLTKENLTAIMTLYYVSMFNTSGEKIFEFKIDKEIKTSEELIQLFEKSYNDQI